MSKASHSRRSDNRKKMKAGRKAANKAKWAALTLSGVNQKSKRYKLRKARTKTIRINRHPLGDCFNTGCSRCSLTGKMLKERYLFARAGKNKK